MKLSRFSFLSTLLVLASCATKTNITAIISNNSVISTSEEKSLVNNKYLHLLDIVERMRVLIEEEEENKQSESKNILFDKVTLEEKKQFLDLLKKITRIRMSL